MTEPANPYLQLYPSSLNWERGTIQRSPLRARNYVKVFARPLISGRETPNPWLLDSMAAGVLSRAEPKSRSVFDLVPDFFDSCRLFRFGLPRLRPSAPSPPPPEPGDASPSERSEGKEGEEEVDSKGSGERGKEVASRWTCNTCKAEFDSLKDQRSHFKSDLHRLNVISVFSPPPPSTPDSNYTVESGWLIVPDSFFS